MLGEISFHSEMFGTWFACSSCVVAFVPQRDMKISSPSRRNPSYGLSIREGEIPTTELNSCLLPSAGAHPVKELRSWASER